MKRLSLKLIASLMLFVCLWSLTDSVQSTFNEDLSMVISQIDDQLANQSSKALALTSGHSHDKETDCDNELCPSHRCHFGHCLFSIAGKSASLIFNFSQLNQSHEAIGESANGINSKLLEPPCS